jgi:hypothetical protein
MKKVKIYKKAMGNETCKCCGSSVPKKDKYYDAYLLAESIRYFSEDKLAILYICREDDELLDLDLIGFYKYDKCLDAYVEFEKTNGIDYINLDEPNSVEFANLIRRHFGRDKYELAEESTKPSLNYES